MKEKEQCEKCWVWGYNLKLRKIVLITGHQYNACINCRKDLKFKDGTRMF